MITWGFLIFMILLCIDQFSGEKETGMFAMQRVSKHGRRKLFQTKLLVCQLSAFLIAVALTYTLRGGECTAMCFSGEPNLFGLSWIQYYSIKSFLLC